MFSHAAFFFKLVNSLYIFFFTVTIRLILSHEWLWEWSVLSHDFYSKLSHECLFTLLFLHCETIWPILTHTKIILSQDSLLLPFKISQILWSKDWLCLMWAQLFSKHAPIIFRVLCQNGQFGLTTSASCQAQMVQYVSSMFLFQTLSSVPEYYCQKIIFCLKSDVCELFAKMFCPTTSTS